MENEYRKQLRRLLNKVNVVTSAHRHGGYVSNKMLDDLSNRQIEVEIEVEEAISSQPADSSGQPKGCACNKEPTTIYCNTCGGSVHD